MLEMSLEYVLLDNVYRCVVQQYVVLIDCSEDFYGFCICFVYFKQCRCCLEVLFSYRFLFYIIFFFEFVKNIIYYVCGNGRI